MVPRRALDIGIGACYDGHVGEGKECNSNFKEEEHDLKT
jgi:hypothetical protein